MPGAAGTGETLSKPASDPSPPPHRRRAMARSRQAIVPGNPSRPPTFLRPRLCYLRHRKKPSGDDAEPRATAPLPRPSPTADPRQIQSAAACATALVMAHASPKPDQVEVAASASEKNSGKYKNKLLRLAAATAPSRPPFMPSWQQIGNGPLQGLVAKMTLAKKTVMHHLPAPTIGRQGAQLPGKQISHVLAHLMRVRSSRDMLQGHPLPL